MNSNNNKSVLTYICYLILFFIVLIVILTVFNMNLFISYFSRMNTTNSFGGFLSILVEYVVAVFKHTLGLV